MALKASELKVGDTYTERLVEDLKRTQIVHTPVRPATTNHCTPMKSSRRKCGLSVRVRPRLLSMGMTSYVTTSSATVV